MLLYGICCNEISNIKWKNVVNLIKDFDEDIYQNLLEDLDNDLSEENICDWISHYESEGSYGIGAFLYDYIQEKENIRLDIDNPDGTFIGVSAGAPWEFDPMIRMMSQSEFNSVISKYIELLTNDTPTIRWWNVYDDQDW